MPPKYPQPRCAPSGQPMTTVVIIGAGISGITAARELSRCSGIRVIVLEALDRLGGRVLSVAAGPNRQYDLGASWFHDVDSNTLLDVIPPELHKGLGIKFDDVPLKLVQIADEHTGPDEHPSLIPALREMMDDVDRTPNVDISLQQFSEQYDRIHATGLAPLARAVEHLTGMPWDEMSSAECPNIWTGESKNAYCTSGMSQVVHWLAQDAIAAGADIRLQSPVATIEARNPDQEGITILLEDGSKLHGDWVICTLPLGVLRAQHRTLFPQPLPSELREAMANAAVASLAKVVLEFPSQFWDGGEGRFEVLARPPEMPCPVFFTNVYNRKPDLLPGPPALVALLAPPLSLQIEANPESVWPLLAPAVRALVADGHSVAETNPTRVIVSSWSMNERFRGSYSSLSVGQSAANLLLPFRAGAGKLRFAGEHTSIDGVGCVHGAYYSGLRESHHILTELNATSTVETV